MRYIDKKRSTGSATKKELVNKHIPIEKNTINRIEGFYDFMVIIVISFLSFSCNGQDCDTIVVEDPAQEKEIISLQEDILVLKSDLKTVRDIVTEQNARISSQNVQIENAANTINSLNAKIVTRDAIIEELELRLAVKPDTIYETIEIVVRDTITVESDFITVGGKEYKVADIELILPRQSKDTLTIETCFTEDKVWFHAGDSKIYPHKIYFPSKELSMVGVTFNDSLTIDMKKYQTTFKIERTKDHSNATTTYRNLFVDPAEYMPTE